MEDIPWIFAVKRAFTWQCLTNYWCSKAYDIICFVIVMELLSLLQDLNKNIYQKDIFEKYINHYNTSSYFFCDFCAIHKKRNVSRYTNWKNLKWLWNQNIHLYILNLQRLFISTFWKTYIARLFVRNLNTYFSNT